MTNFALITEGITDQVAIEAILIGHYQLEVDCYPIQPLRDATDVARQGNFAGWEKVLDYCSDDQLAKIFSTNDYLIIQFDTDVCEHPNIGIPLTDAGGDRPSAELVADIKNLIIRKISPLIFQQYKEKIFFAVCVHSLECWILPLYNPSYRKGEIKNCENRLARHLNKKDLDYIKDYRTYQSLTNGFMKNKNLLICRKKNESLDNFLLTLPDLLEEE